LNLVWERVGLRIWPILLPPILEEFCLEAEIFLGADENLAPAAVDGRARFDDDVAVRTSGMRLNLEPANSAPAVKALVVAAQLAEEITLLVGEVALRVCNCSRPWRSLAFSIQNRVTTDSR